LDIAGDTVDTMVVIRGVPGTGHRPSPDIEESS